MEKENEKDIDYPNTLMSVAPEVLSSNLASNHTKEQITNRFLAAKPKTNFRNDFEVYNVFPITTGPNYVEGRLSNSAKTDTLNMLNFYRWLNGSKEVEIKEDLISPVNKGDRVGKMCVLIGEDTIYKLDILAKNDIRKKGIWDYFEEVGYKFLENNFEKIIEKSA